MRKYWKLIALATFLLLIIIINFSGYFSYLNLHQISSNYLFIENYIDSNFFSACLIFILVYILAVIVVMPGAWLLTFSGGFFFGWIIGSFLTIIGATIGACILFILSKSILGKYLNQKIKNKKGVLANFEKNINDNAFNYLLFMRLMPLFPFVFVNIAPSLLGIGFFVFFITTCLGIIPATIIYSLLGSGASDIFVSGDLFHIKNLISYKIVIGLGGLSLLSLIPIIFKYKKHN
ncbi:MAG: hypothetical protein CMJ14_03875 [Pelagibacterales bacterium]|nr:hypothetical protein [Pelagibacterales bacterium]|tara:strand:+ start:2665 stop:3366 length:702 start_codon:yes stop_codon:yes gene_type:complete